MILHLKRLAKLFPNALGILYINNKLAKYLQVEIETRI